MDQCDLLPVSEDVPFTVSANPSFKALLMKFLPVKPIGPLVAIDCQSKMLSCMPLASKGSNLRGQAEHLVRFSMALNHMDKVEFVSDAEPTMKSLLASVQLLR